MELSPMSPTSPGEILARSALAVRPRDDGRVTAADRSAEQPCRPTLVMSCRARTRRAGSLQRPPRRAIRVDGRVADRDLVGPAPSLRGKHRHHHRPPRTTPRRCDSDDPHPGEEPPHPDRLTIPKRTRTDRSCPPPCGRAQAAFRSFWVLEGYGHETGFDGAGGQ